MPPGVHKDMPGQDILPAGCNKQAHMQMVTLHASVPLSGGASSKHLNKACFLGIVHWSQLNSYLSS
jgi:hypothetical protein